MEDTFDDTVSSWGIAAHTVPGLEAAKEDTFAQTLQDTAPAEAALPVGSLETLQDTAPAVDEQTDERICS
jgi:hypothetical protein